MSGGVGGDQAGVGGPIGGLRRWCVWLSQADVDKVGGQGASQPGIGFAGGVLVATAEAFQARSATGGGRGHGLGTPLASPLHSVWQGADLRFWFQVAVSEQRLGWLLHGLGNPLSRKGGPLAVHA